MKLSILDDLKQMLDDRMASRMKPKSVDISVATDAKPMDHEVSELPGDSGYQPEVENPKDEPMPSVSQLDGAPEGHEVDEPHGFEAEMQSEGCDLSTLSPDEQDKLRGLYEKMQMQG